MGYVTIKDIAKAIGLSKSTVSRALSGDGNVSKETRDKVQAMADKMGYERNELAANLRHQNTRTVGIIVPEMITPFFMSVVISAQKVLNENDYKVIITQSHEDIQAELYNIELMEKYRVDGIIMSVCDVEHNLKEYFRIQKKGIPIVFFDRVPPKICATKIIVDDYVKSMLMMEHLIKIGRRRIVHLAGPRRIPNAAERKKAYVDSLAKFKIPFDPELLLEGENERSEGQRLIKTIIDKNISFDAVFSFGETLSIGALNYMKTQNIRVPEDVAICGFSGTYLSTIVTPQLTAIQQPFEEMGKIAAEQIIVSIEDTSSTTKTIMLNTEIVLRQSTFVFKDV